MKRIIIENVDLMSAEEEDLLKNFLEQNRIAFELLHYDPLKKRRDENMNEWQELKIKEQENRLVEIERRISDLEKRFSEHEITIGLHDDTL